MRTTFSASSRLLTPISIQISCVSGTFLRSSGLIRWIARFPVTPLTGPDFVRIETRRPEIIVLSWPPSVSK